MKGLAFIGIKAIISDDRIINQQGRDDSFNGLTYLKALGKCQPKAPPR